MLESTVTEKGQTTVPKPIRDALRVKAGERIQWDLEGGTVTVRAEPSALTLFGSLKSRKKFPGIHEEQAAMRKQVARVAAREHKRDLR